MSAKRLISSDNADYYDMKGTFTVGDLSNRTAKANVNRFGLAQLILSGIFT
jgi:hypothetical protein